MKFKKEDEMFYAYLTFELEWYESQLNLKPDSEWLIAIVNSLRKLIKKMTIENLNKCDVVELKNVNISKLVDEIVEVDKSMRKKKN